MSKRSTRQRQTRQAEQPQPEALPQQEQHAVERRTLAPPRVGHDFSQISVLPPPAASLQPKLTANAPAEQVAQEADQVAEAVLGMEAPGAQPDTAAPGGAQLQRQAASGATPPVSPDLEATITGMRGGGQPLDPATRAFMEPRFGHSFAAVRVHTDDRAVAASRGVNALAFTVGPNIAFGAGQYQPASDAGRQLLAHELTHVVQQTSGIQAKQVSESTYDDMLQRRATANLSTTAPIVQQWTVGNQFVERLLHKNQTTQQVIMRSDDKEQQSRQSKPKNAPRGTKPIDQSGLDKDQVHEIKDGVGAGPKDWTGISPEGHVITGDGDGNAVDNGPWEDYTHSQYQVPKWLWEALAGVALAAGTLALIVCFATGPCSLGALIGGLGYATALIILGLLKGKGGSESTVADKENDQEDNSQGDEVEAYA